MKISKPGDQYGDSALYLMNRAGLHGAMFESNHDSTPLVYVAVNMVNAAQRNVRLEGKSSTYARCGIYSFHMGGPDVTIPTCASGDTYDAITKNRCRIMYRSRDFIIIC